MTSVGAWLQGNLRVYRDNATTVKDFRAQLRGSKAVWLWTLYLLLLLALSMLTYAGVASNFRLSVSMVQLQLRGYYTATMAMLAGAVCLIAPSLTAGSIVVEKQRRSLDLLFSAPVSLKGLLVGKVLSSYRYIWMLLVLSIPLTSVAVVMGGATWWDVLQTYAELSFAGLVITSMGLLISSLCESVGAAVVWTYVATIGYIMVTAAVATPGAVTSRGSLEVPFLGSLNPFYVAFMPPTYTVIFGVHVGNWIFAGLASLLIARIFLLGAASTLSLYGAKETASFRLQALIYLLLFLVALSWSYNGIVTTPNEIGTVVAIACCTLFIFLPHLTCYSKDAGRKYGYDVRPRPEGFLTGARSGSLYYLLAIWLVLMLSTTLGILFALNSSPSFVGLPAAASHHFGDYVPGLLQTGAWSLGFLFMVWGLARGISSRSKSLKMARAGLIGAMILLFGLPIPIISLLTVDSYGGTGYTQPEWSMSFFYPFMRHLETAWIYGLVMVLIGFAGLRLEKEFRSHWEEVLS